MLNCHPDNKFQYFGWKIEESYNHPAETMADGG
jgi:hypothetical protein